MNQKIKPLNLNEVSYFFYDDDGRILKLVSEGTNYQFDGEQAIEIHKILLSKSKVNEQKSGKQLIQG